jgi:hypothetical protein
LIPHELAHLIIDQRVFNCRGSELPIWLQEGFAVFAETPDARARYDVDSLKRAIESGRIDGLRATARQFPEVPNSVRLVYAYGGDVTRFLHESGGPDKMRRFLDELRSGASTDSALTRVYGFDTDGLDAAWRASVGVKKPPYATTLSRADNAAPQPTARPFAARPSNTPTPKP